MKSWQQRVQSAFTLVELMIVVVILGILAAVAIPAFTRYVKRSKTAEGTMNVAKIAQAEIVYFQSSSERSTASFASAGPTPSAAPTASKYAAQPTAFTGDSNWTTIGFSIDGPFYYQYVTTGTTTAFTAQANGDIDGDTVLSTFRRTCTVSAGETQQSQIIITNELE